MPRVIVQRITTTWTKRSRGAAGREHRARLPVAYPLPDAALVSRSASMCQEIDRHEASVYREREAISFDAQPTAWSRRTLRSAVRLRLGGAGLEVAFNGTGVGAYDAGRPPRWPMPAKVLRSTQVATVRFNGRFVGYEEAWYEDKILHVAFDATPHRELFLSTSAAFVIDARVD